MRAVLIVMSDAVEGADGDYNDWYDRVHLPDVLRVPGLVGARRFVAEPSVHGELPAQRYLAIYEMEGEDLDALHGALSAAAARMEISPAFDRARTVTYTYRLLTDGSSP